MRPVESIFIASRRRRLPTLLTSLSQACSSFQLEPSAHLIIAWPLFGMAHGGEHRTACHALLQRGEQTVREALRCEPFAKEARLHEFVARNHVGNRNRLLIVEENYAWKHGIQLPVRVQVDLKIGLVKRIYCC
jgi:hypothetical protein